MLEWLVSFNWDQVSSHDTGLAISNVWPWSHFSVYMLPNSIFNDTSWYIIESSSSSFVQNTSLLHIPLRWLISMELHQKIMFLIWSTYQLDTTAKVCCSLFYCSRRNSWSFCKSLLLYWCYMTLSITFLSRWDFPLENNDSTYLFFPRFSISTDMFPIQ